MLPFPDLSTNLNPASAVMGLRRALALDPGSWELRLSLCSLLLQLQRFEEAIPHGEKLLLTEPGDPQVQLFLAWAQLGMGDPAAALATMEGHPREAGCCAELGAAAGEYLGRWQDAERMLLRAMDLNKNDPEIYHVLCVVLTQQYRFDEALSLARDAEARFAKDPAQVGLFRFHQATSHLLQGHYQEGFPCFEGRLAMKKKSAPMRELPLRTWKGESLRGETLLLRWAEGYGDVFMCVRFAPMLKAMGATVLLESRPSATALLATCEGLARVIEDPTLAPPEAYQVPIMSILQRLDLHPETLPARVPYLCEPGAVIGRAKLDALLQGCPPGPKIGLVWAGNVNHERDHQRSLPPEVFDLFAEVTNVVWVSLQKEPGPRPAIPLVDLGPHLSDYSDTAYVLSRIDGLISVDTSAIHLAGAMGKPAWLMLSHLPDWRWMIDRKDTPWYPTVELWRQASVGDWASVVKAMVQRLVSAGFP